MCSITKTLKVDPLTDDPFKDFQASWSGDGNIIYFLSNRTGRDEIWKMPAAGGSRVQVTRMGGAMAVESPDRRFLYYAKILGAQNAIWRVPVDGGEEEPIVEGLNNPLNFAVAKRGVYFVVRGDATHLPTIDFFEFATGKRTTIVKPSKRSWIGLAVSPNEEYVVYPAIEGAGSDFQ